jgi:pimeloyl-ACP methyl ester carboxylesterase/uncharacterized damage-inducible protein DinB
MNQKRMFLLLAVLISTVAVCGQQAASGGNSPADIVYARPGQLVDVGGFRLNLYCMGSGSPAVVFDSGFGDWAPAWSTVQPRIAKWTRACSYDRAGAGFSDPGPMPRTSVRIAGELRTALHNAGIAGPYILVGSAYGGDNVRTFADLYMDEVAGMVLDDADSDDVEPKEMQEEAHRGHAGLPSDLRACRNLIAEHKPLPNVSGPGQPPQTCAQQFFFRGLPEVEWSPELNAKVLEIAQTKAAMYDADASEMEQTPADETYLQQHRRSFGARPIRVLTSGNHGVGHLEEKPPDTPKHLKYEQETTLAQARWLELSSNAKQIFTHNSSEYIQFDEPETLINAVREVYDQSGRSAQQEPTLASTVDREVSAIEKQIVDVAEAMPEDKFNFSPESLNIPGSDYRGVRSFAVQVKHIAASNYFIWSPLTGDKVPENIKDGNGPENLKSKAEIIKFLKESFALGHKAAATLTTENMLQPASIGEHKSTRLHLAEFAVAHAFDHYGQMVEYLRMNGIVPPASRGKSD